MWRRKNETLTDFRARKNAIEVARRDRDRDAFNAQRRDHYSRNKDKIRAKNLIWRHKPEVNDVLNSKQRVRNKTPQYRAMRRRMRKSKQEADLNFRLKQALRSRLHSALKGLTRSASTMKLIGCDTGFLRLYIEARFEPWMNWANWGEWHIDHIIPCAEFDLTKPEQQRQCFHYTNLRPLRAEDNHRWRNKRPMIHQPEIL